LHRGVDRAVRGRRGRVLRAGAARDARRSDRRTAAGVAGRQPLSVYRLGPGDVRSGTSSTSARKGSHAPAFLTALISTAIGLDGEYGSRTASVGSVRPSACVYRTSMFP